MTPVIWYASGTLTLFVICNGGSRQDASNPEKSFINAANHNISSPKSAYWQSNKLTVLSRVILRSFETDNSPLCTGAPSKAENISQSERSYYSQLRSYWLMFFRLRNCNTVNRRLMIDFFGPRYVSKADDGRMSEIEQAFQVVRGGQFYWFSLAPHVYRLLTRPKLGSERRLEAEEIRRSSGGFRPRRS